MSDTSMSITSDSDDYSYFKEDDSMENILIPENQRIQMTEELDNFLMMIFQTFDDNNSGKINRFY